MNWKSSPTHTEPPPVPRGRLKGKLMLRITIHHDPGSLTVQMEGRLVGPWVREAEECWQRIVAGERQPVVRIDLRGLVVIDPAVKVFLRTAYAEGAELIVCGCQLSAIVVGMP